MSYTYQFPRPALTVDCLVITYHKQQLKILLIQRKKPPFADKWALPGGFVEIDEPLETAARRELYEETGMQVNNIYQLYTFGAPDRDPRGRAVSVAYTTMVKSNLMEYAKAASDAKATDWFPIHNLPPLSFDHQEIFDKALQDWQFMIRHQPFGKPLLSAKFYPEDLQKIYEEILGKKIDKQILNNALINYNILIPEHSGLFTFNENQYKKYLETGFFIAV